MTTVAAGRIVVLDPSGPIYKQPTSLAPRINDLRGKTVGLMDDTAPGSNILLEQVGILLRERYGVAKVIQRRKPNLSLPAPKAMIEQFKSEVDCMVVGVGA